MATPSWTGAHPTKLAGAVSGTTVAAAVVTLAVVAVVLAFQPVGSPWWIDANSDASYTASGVDLMAGEHTQYLGQPGMPLQDLMAITTETRYIAHKMTSEHETPHAYAAQRLLHLDDSRIFFRGYAILFFVAAALLAFVVLSRLLGSPWWGAAGGLLFVSAPGLPAMSIQLAPDVALAGLVLAVGSLVVRAAERRDAWLFALAAFLLGLATTLKVQAIGLAVPLALALIARPPQPDLSNARRWLHRFRVPLVAFFAIWVLFCVTFDRTRVPLKVTHHEATVMTTILVVALCYVASVAVVARTEALRSLARGPIRPVGLLIASAFAGGVLLPGTLFINDLPRVLVAMGSALGHGGVDRALPGTSPTWNELVHAPVVQALILLVLAGVAAGIGLGVRELQPMVWFSGAAAMFVLATLHPGPVVNFAPAFVLSIPPVLWLARRLPPLAAPAAAVALVAASLVPALRDVAKPADAARLEERQAAAMTSIADRLLGPGKIALTEDFAPLPDVRWHDDVQQIVAWVPSYPYRFLPDSPDGVNTSARLHLAPALYVGRLAAGIHQRQTVPIQFGPYVMKPLPGDAAPQFGIGTTRLLAGPGIDQPLEHPDARYDPKTGDYRDSSGHYWDLWGNPIENPPARSSG